jgi:hypothetical protein
MGLSSWPVRVEHVKLGNRVATLRSLCHINSILNGSSVTLLGFVHAEVPAKAVPLRRMAKFELPETASLVKIR